MGHDAEGVDFAPAMLELARRNAAERDPAARFTEGEAGRLPFPDGTFDVVHARMVLWTQPDLDRTLREWLRVLRPGGRLVVVEGTWRPPGPVARARRALRRGLARVRDALGGRRDSPAAPLPFDVEIRRRLYPGLDVLPFLWGVTPDDLRRVLTGLGLTGVVVRDLVDLRAWARARIPMPRRIFEHPMRGACIGWGCTGTPVEVSP
jgi:SAM-dependent methyltransferase